MPTHCCWCSITHSLTRARTLIRLQEFSKDPGNLVFIKIDVDENEEAAAAYDPRPAPTHSSSHRICLSLPHTLTHTHSLCIVYTYHHRLAINPFTCACRCGISAMPTFQVWKAGAKVDELVGASKDKLAELIAKYK